MIKPLKLKHLTLSGNLMLSPLAGYTDIAFRRLVRECGAALTTTEMVSVKGLCYNNPQTGLLLQTADNEKPSSVQLFGSDPEFFTEALKRDELSKFDIVDINMGCPMPKIIKNGDGSALMKDPLLAAKIIESVAKTDKVVTVKFRSGWDENSKNAVEFAKIIEASGADMITVHGRTAAQKYSGFADWDIIGEVASEVKIPVIGNGDIVSRLLAVEAIKNYKVAGVMIGRGAIGNPQIFCADAEKDAKFNAKIVLRHIDYMLEYFSVHYTITNMRKHLAYYLKGVKNSKDLRRDLNFIDNIEVLKNRLAELETL